MKKIIKRVMRFYWRHSQAYALLTLPLNGIGALSSLLVLFTVVTNIRFPALVYVVLFLVSTVALFLLGDLAKKTGLLEYWQSLNNSQNVELRQILEKLTAKHPCLPTFGDGTCVIGEPHRCGQIGLA